MGDSIKQPLSGEALASLVDRAKQGDQEAFTRIYEQTHQEVYRTIRSMVRSEDLALDIQQDVYVVAFSHLNQLSAPERLRPWLRSIAVNQTRTALRKRTPVLFTELETGAGEGIPELADLSPEASPELSLDRKETAALVNQIMDSLTEGQRAVIGMYYYEQMPVGVIAEELGISPGTVKSQLFRGRKKIEASVKSLEAQGIKLYGMAPLPFFLALLGREAPAAEASAKVLSGAIAKTAATKTVAVHVGRRFFETLAGKAVLGLLSAAAIGGGIAGYNLYQERVQQPAGDYQPTTIVETLETATEEPTTQAEPETQAVETRFESDEDLITEPVIILPVTEPSTTEPPATEAPTEAPAEDSTEVPTEEPTVSQSPQPSSQPAEPTVPPTAPPSSSRMTHFDHMESLEVGYWAHYHINIDGDAVPVLYTDHPEILHLEYKGTYVGGSVPSWETGHFWYVEALDAGEANLYCTLNGETVLVSSVNVLLPPISWHPEMPPVEDVIIDFEEETQP